MFGITVAASCHAAFVAAALLASASRVKHKANNQYKLVGNLLWNEALHAI